MPSLSLSDQSKVVREIVHLEFVDDGGTARLIQTLSIVDKDSVERVVFQYFRVAVSPSAVDGTAAIASPATITTGSATVSTTSGTSPFTYLWAPVDLGGNYWTISTASSAATSFVAHGVGAGSEWTATFKCTVTDATGVIRATSVVTATANNSGA